MGHQGSIRLDGSEEMPRPQGSRGPSGPLRDETETCHEPLGAIGALGRRFGRTEPIIVAMSRKRFPGGGQGRDHVAAEADTRSRKCPPDSYDRISLPTPGKPWHKRLAKKWVLFFHSALPPIGLAFQRNR